MIIGVLGPETLQSVFASRNLIDLKEVLWCLTPDRCVCVMDRCVCDKKRVPCMREGHEKKVR